MAVIARRCLKCRGEFGLDSFGSAGPARGGVRPYCLRCERARDKARYEAERNGTATPRRGRERSPRPATVGRPVTVAEVNWIAGFLEGEGTFTTQRKKKGIQVSASQVQLEPLTRLQRLLGGRILARPARGRSRSCFFWRACGNRARGIAYTLYSLMSPKRKQQIREALGVQSEAAAA